MVASGCQLKPEPRVVPPGTFIWCRLATIFVHIPMLPFSESSMDARDSFVAANTMVDALRRGDEAKAVGLIDRVT